MCTCTCDQKIEKLRAEMVRIFEENNNSFTNQSVIKISQELDAILVQHARCQRLSPINSIVYQAYNA